MPNAFLQKQEIAKKLYWENGVDSGFQKCWDLVQLCLHDPAVMGKDVFGKDRLDRLFKALHQYEREYGDAWTDDVEADALQEKIDAGLREIHGKDFVPFHARYPNIIKQDYSHGKKR